MDESLALMQQNTLMGRTSIEYLSGEMYYPESVYISNRWVYMMQDKLVGCYTLYSFD